MKVYALLALFVVPLSMSGCTLFTELEADDSADTNNMMSDMDHQGDMPGIDVGNNGVPPDMDNADMAAPPPSLWRSFSLGDDHGCGVTRSGNGFCWGDGYDGKLGNGTRTDFAVPTRVLHTEEFQIIEAGGEHTCALDLAGSVYCWGDSENIGEGDVDATVPLLRPLDVPLVSLSAGINHTCGVSADNDVYCLGEDNAEQLGVPGMGDNLVFEQVPDLKASAVGAGEYFTCALSLEGAIYCWGREFSVYGSTVTIPEPTVVPVPSSAEEVFVHLSVGEDHVCALNEEGQAFCWGDEYWMDDLRTITDKTVPAPLTSPVRFKSLDSGNGFTCGIDLSDMVQCWGHNRRAPLGNGEEENSTSTAVDVNPIDRPDTYKEVYAGETFGCAVTMDDETYCWGHNLVGRLGIGEFGETATPVNVVTDEKFEKISAGHYHTCGITGEREVFCWGRGGYYALGNGSNEHQYFPTHVPGITGAQLIDSGSSQTCVTTTTETFCWGDNQDGSLGNGSTADSNLPVRVATTETFETISVGGSIACGTTAARDAWCWGDGELIDPIVPMTSIPIMLSHAIPYREVEVGQTEHACGLAEDGTVHCWGDNGYGQLGNLTLTDSLLPVPAETMTKFVDVTVGERVSCALDALGLAYCWGDGPQHALGNWSTQLFPADIRGGHFWKKLSPYHENTCGITIDGDVYCWGVQSSLRLGSDGGSLTEPTQVQGVSDAIDITSGSSFACALVTGGDVYCWGARTHGQLGDGIDSIKYSPVRFADSEVE